jgi:hypothetical protein
MSHPLIPSHCAAWSEQDPPAGQPSGLSPSSWTWRFEYREAILGGPVERRKAILQELVAEVRAESRSCIRPTFRVPSVGFS